MLKQDAIQFIPDSQGRAIKTYRGMAVVIDDGLTVSNGVFMTALFGTGAIGYAVAEPNEAPGTELFRNPAVGNGAGSDTLFSRLNLALHPLGYQWLDASVASAFPAIAVVGLEIFATPEPEASRLPGHPDHTSMVLYFVAST